MLAKLLQLVLLLTVLAGTAASAAPQAIPEYQRAYLLTDDGKFAYWSFDPDEEGANARTLVRTCPGLVDGSPCYTGATTEGLRYWQFSFNPHSVVEGTAAWSAQNPLRFHLEMEIDLPVEYTVRLAAASFTQGIQISGPASEVAPGVWEGTITQPGVLSPSSSKQFFIRIEYTGAPAGPGTPMTLRLETDGSSYVELPAPVGGWSLTDIRSADASSEVQRYETKLRELTFNDSDWEAFSFEGDLSQARQFSATLDRKAAGVMGFVEAFSEPVLYDAIRNGHAAPEQVTDAPVTSLLDDGQSIAAGANSQTENAGRGTDSVAATDVSAGVVTLTVGRNNFAQTGFPYRAYIVVVYGERTLRSYRAEYTPRNSVQTPQVRVGSAGACSHFSERVPVTNSARAISADIDVDTINPAQRWTLAYGQPSIGYYPCGESGIGNSVTVTKQSGDFVFDTGVTLANGGGVNTHNRDAVVEELVRIYYRPEVASA